MSLLQRLTPTVDCSCNGEYKHPVKAGCWKDPNAAWNSLDFRLPCYIKIGGNKEGFDGTAISISRIVIIVLILGLVLWLVFGKHDCPHKHP